MHYRERKSIRLQLLAADPRCWFCSRPLTVETSTIDHFTPLAEGGSDTRDNMLLACPRCNRRKADNGVEVLACQPRRGEGLHLPRDLHRQVANFWRRRCAVESARR